MQEERRYHSAMLLAGGMLIAAWGTEAARFFESELLPLRAVPGPALEHLLVLLAVSFALAYPVWASLLNRRRGCLALLASSISLCWSVAEFVPSLRPL